MRHTLGRATSGGNGRRAPRTGEVFGSSFSLGGLFSVGSTPRAPRERAKTAAASRGPRRTCASAGTATAARASTAATRRRIDQDDIVREGFSRRNPVIAIYPNPNGSVTERRQPRRSLPDCNPLDCNPPGHSVVPKPFVVSYGYTEHSRQHHATKPPPISPSSSQGTPRPETRSRSTAPWPPRS